MTTRPATRAQRAALAALAWAAFGFALAIAACGRSKPAPGSDAPPSSAAPAVAAPQPSAEPTAPRRADESALLMPGTELTHDAIAEELAIAEPQSFSSVGSTSVVFRTKLDAPFDAAFKAMTKDRPQSPLAELGAYRIARCLGLDAAPPVVARSFPLDQLRARYDASAGKRAAWAELEPRLSVTREDLVPGVLSYWIRDLSDVGLDPKTGLERAREWLRIGGKLPQAERSLAASVSVLLGFDYMVGNFDRWSGSNTKGDAEKTRVYPRDNDLALPARLSDALHQRLARQLLVAQRISAGFYKRALELDRSCIEGEALASGSRDAQVLGQLSAAQVDGVFDRRAGFVSHVQALIEEHGAEKVLFFD